MRSLILIHSYVFQSQALANLYRGAWWIAVSGDETENRKRFIAFNASWEMQLSQTKVEILQNCIHSRANFSINDFNYSSHCIEQNLIDQLNNKRKDISPKWLEKQSKWRSIWKSKQKNITFSRNNTKNEMLF